MKEESKVKLYTGQNSLCPQIFAEIAGSYAGGRFHRGPQKNQRNLELAFNSAQSVEISGGGSPSPSSYENIFEMNFQAD